LAECAHGGSWSRHISAAISQACHMGCWCVGGSLGKLTGVQLEARIILSASRKLRNKEATNRSCGQQDFSGVTLLTWLKVPSHSITPNESSQPKMRNGKERGYIAQKTFPPKSEQNSDPSIHPASQTYMMVVISCHATAFSKSTIHFSAMSDPKRNNTQKPTWRNSFWNRALGRVFQAMVSVMAVKIQFSSPSGVLRSVCLPGMRSMRSLVSPSLPSRLLAQNHRRATCGRSLGLPDIQKRGRNNEWCLMQRRKGEARDRMGRKGTGCMEVALPSSRPTWSCY